MRDSEPIRSAPTGTIISEPALETAAERGSSGGCGSATITVDLDVPASMRDGVVLRANVFRPAGSGPWPTLLARLPYGKDGPVLSDWLDPMRAAREGFMVVVQDTRGRFCSDGRWVPFRFEREDGFDSVEWAARLAGSNGRVGMFGPSYLGNTQWMAAIEQPRALGAIAPGFTWSDPLDGLFARGGALELGLASAWTLETGVGEVARRAVGSESDATEQIAAMMADYSRLPERGYWDLPASLPETIDRHRVPDIGTFSMRRDASIPDRCRVAGRHDSVSVPSLHIGGWHDVFLQGTLDNFARMRALGRPARLVVGPWTHAGSRDPIGELCFGVLGARLGAPSHPVGDLTDVQLRWFKRHLDGAADVGEDDDPPVRLFVMGRDEWRDEQEWPLPRARTERWFLGAEGRLSPPGDETDPGGTTEFVYDPADPVPTVGGPIVMTPAISGPRDQRAVEAREDVRVFTSAPLPRDLEVTGRVMAVLEVDSSAPSTDWVVRLCDVYPDGRSLNLCDGIARVEAGRGGDSPVALDLWSTSNVFRAGHRLRIHVTSSSFPRWDRNLNTGDQSGRMLAPARQTIHHGGERRSWIELPVVDPP